jgi:hypothetical protein
VSYELIMNWLRVNWELTTSYLGMNYKCTLINYEWIMNRLQVDYKVMNEIHVNELHSFCDHV